MSLFKFCDTALRIPPLFLIDEIIECVQGIASYSGYAAANSEIHPLFNEDVIALTPSSRAMQMDKATIDSSSIDPAIADFDELSKKALLPVLGKLLCFSMGVFIAVVAFILTWNKLLKLYSFLISVSIVVASYQANMASVKIVITATQNNSYPPLLQSLLAMNSSAIWDSGGIAFSILFNYILQGTLGIVFTVLIAVCLHSAFRAVVVFNFLAPTFLLILPVPVDILFSAPLFSALLPLGIIKYVLITNINNCFSVFVEGYQYARMVLSNYGLHSFLESEWIRLNVPSALRAFWVIRTIHHLSILVDEHTLVKGDFSSLMKVDVVYHIFKEVMTKGCETVIALLGMTSIVSFLSHYIGVLFQYLMMYDDDEERSMGTTSAVLFFVLAGQSSLTLLESEKRFERLCRNFSFLFTAMLHFTHEMVNPVLMSLSASRNPALHRHIRALTMCVILLACPCLLLNILWREYPLTTWLLAVSAFSIQVIVKTTVSVLIYAFFLLDAHRNSFRENLDDYVYYIKAVGNSVEFMFGILLFFTGAYIYFFESGGTFKAVVMCVHAYFNIWCEAKNGWSVFMKRRTAVNKMSTLPDATLKQLEEHNDVCAICFQDMENAKITRCKHLFHSICLRKWLYVQDSCPLCYNTLYKTEQPPTDDEEEREHRDSKVVWDQDDTEVILAENIQTNDASVSEARPQRSEEDDFLNNSVRFRGK